jgi:hypothetical protein
MSYTNGLDKPSEYFNTVLYTGTDSAQSVTGVGFSPEFTWIKCRSHGGSVSFEHILTDIIRGGTKSLTSNDAGAEVTNNATGYLNTFDLDGFTTAAGSTSIDAVGGNLRTYASWNWKANGAGVSNTDGTITSTVSANTTAGFSIVSYTGTGSAGATIGHGLGAVPRMIIVKNRDAADAWQVYHAANTANPETDYLVLNTTAATADNINRWNDTLPTSTLFSIGDGVEVNTNTEDYIAYCFAEVKSYSKFGSYTGNGSADGSFLYLGFRPSWLLIKRTDSAGYDWLLYDNKRQVSFNVVDDFLNPNSSSAETTGNANQSLDFLSNGVKFRGNGASSNGSGATYIYMAFAENPFVTSSGIPTTAR